jgi:hypothetical protein
LPLAAPLVGAQRPRISCIPPFVTSSGPEALDLCCDQADMNLDDWEQFGLSSILNERADGQWAALQGGLCVPRQNGKTEIFTARELVGLYLLDERLIVHSAHLFDTSLEAFARLLAIIEAHPQFSRRIAKNGVSYAHGREGIKLKSGQRIRFKTRTKDGGRGLTGDLVVLDEAMRIPNESHAAMFPLVAARPHPQVLYGGSSVDQQTMEHGVVFSRVRAAGMRGEPGVLYLEWSAPLEIDKLTPEALLDRRNWLTANPGLGIRITEDYVGKEFTALGPRKFAVERLGVGDWPNPDEDAFRVIDLAQWDNLADAVSFIPESEPVVFALDAQPGGVSAAIAGAGLREDGQPHLGVIQHDRGTAWVVPRMLDLNRKHKPVAIVGDPRGPAGDVVSDLERALGKEITRANLSDQATGFAMFTRRVQQGTLRHLGQPDLRAAIDGADKRDIGDGACAWSRKNSTVDISPLVAATLALWALSSQPAKRYRVINLNKV